MVCVTWRSSAWHMITGDLPPSSSVTWAPSNPTPLGKWMELGWHCVTVMMFKKKLLFFHWNNMVNSNSTKFRVVTHRDSCYWPRILVAMIQLQSLHPHHATPGIPDRCQIGCCSFQNQLAHTARACFDCWALLASLMEDTPRPLLGI